MKIIETVYAPEADMTFILEGTYSGDDTDLVKTECVGWYYGEPNEHDTKYFYGKLTATY